MRLFRALSALLCYPEMELLDSLSEIDGVVHAEHGLADDTRRALVALTVHLRETPLLDLQEEYVELFDRTRMLSLHLYEHVHGDARQRGQAMADLVEVYRRAGFALASPELPDFLPVVLEFLSVAPAPERDALLRDAAPLLALLASRLERRGSAYRAPLAALSELGGVCGVAEDPETSAPATPGLEALDAAWAEAPVEFGLGAGGERCGTGGSDLLDIEPPPGRAGVRA